jgi:hypothetical protein
MTEAEWLTFTDPDAALQGFLGKDSERKLRMFACACCRRIWHALTDPKCQEAVEVAERYADGLANDEEVSQAQDAVAVVRGWNAERQEYDPWQSAFFAPEVVQYALRRVKDHGYDWATAGIAADRASIAAYYDVLRRRGQNIDRAVPDEEIDWEEERAIRQPEIEAQCRILRDLLGNPFRPVALHLAWLSPTVVSLAHAAYDERRLPSGTLDPIRLAILADALEEAGCADASILDHLREPGPHVRGCWVLDLLLGQS